jgi:hypothetical protein
MPGGGLFSLVAYGAQNVILSGNPDMTYFYKTFKKYTHFSMETISKAMDGPTDYPYDSSIQIRTRIDRVGDLVSDMYFTFQIPAIYSKDKIFQSKELEFQWVRALGAAAIQTVYVTVGPNNVQEFTGDYIMAKALIDYPADDYAKWQRLVGDIPELTDPANGIYSSLPTTNDTYTLSGVLGYNDSSRSYPTVVEDLSRGTGQPQTNNPSIPAYTITVPLPFWFTEGGHALPLIGLQYYTVDVTIILNPSQQLYTVRDSTPFGFRMAPGQSVDVYNQQAVTATVNPADRSVITIAPISVTGILTGTTLTVSGIFLSVGTILSGSITANVIAVTGPNTYTISASYTGTYTFNALLALEEGSTVTGMGFTSCVVTNVQNAIYGRYTLSSAQPLGTYQLQVGLINPLKEALIQQNIPGFIPSPTPSNYEIRQFLTDINATVPTLNYWILNPQLYTTYIFLPDSERELFATKPLIYPIRQVTKVSFPEITSNELLELYIHNPITRMIIIPRRSDSLVYRNHVMNFTNWWDWPNRPSIATMSPTSLVSSGVAIPAGQRDIITRIRILADGNELQEYKSAQFFSEVTPFRYLSGGANRGLPVYSFELHSPNHQPSGSLNSSRINRLQLDVQVNQLATESSYIYGIDVYVENLNFFLVESGMGAPKYAS